MNKFRKLITTVFEKSGIDKCIDERKVNLYLEKLRNPRRKILKGSKAHLFIANTIREANPAALAKIGDVECAALSWHLGIGRFYKYTWATPSYGQLGLKEQAGVFPKSEEIYHRFCDLLLERIEDIDTCAVWFNPGESEIIGDYCPHSTFIELTSLEPYYYADNPWSFELAGKKILVIHPFADSIQNQYRKRDEIWCMYPKILPEFKLLTLKSPYGFSHTDFSDWFEMLAWLENQIEGIRKSEDFDLALIGCGAAGIPLASYVKRLGKIGIHMGGPIQILFGIMGRRWDNRIFFRNLYNPSWVRPQSKEKPPESDIVDGGGYW